MAKWEQAPVLDAPEQRPKWEQAPSVQELIQEKVKSGVSLSRKDISNFGITEKTNTKQRQVITDALRRQADSLRPDGTKKGKGFLGEQKLPGGGVTSEYSVGVQLKSRGGKETDIPTLVPTLTPEERTLMINDIIPNKKPVPDSIIQKAVDHANKRVGEGKDVFFQEGEDVGRSKGEEFIDAVARGSARVGSALAQTAAGLVGADTSGIGTWYPKTAEVKKGQKELTTKLKEQSKLLWEVSRHPDLAAQNKDLTSKALNLIGETIPYITGTTAAYIAGGPLGGFAVGSMVEGNSAYREALDSGVNEKKAKMIGVGVGVVSGAIEAFGGKYAEQLLMRAATKVKSKLAKAGAVLAIGTAVEALEEGAQEITAITGEETYRDVSWKEGVNRTLGSMAGGAFLGGVMRGASVAGRGILKEQPVVEPGRKTPYEPEPGAVEEVPPISEAIERPTGLPAIEETPTEAIPATERPVGARTGQEALITPEEELETPEEAVKAEATLETEADEELEPELYIGNVTARMKRVMGEAVGKEAEDVKGFTEKGFPTKRTKIKMTRGEAEEYLEWLERDLQDRVDNNKINNDEQISLAHADWGDIATLRRKLGIPVGTEPFRIVYAQKPGMVIRDKGEIKVLETETKKLRKQLGQIAIKEARDQGLSTEDEKKRNAIEDQIREKQQLINKMQKAQGAAASVIKDTTSMIYGAVEPSRLQESKMTVQEVLQAVMKRGARFAKMAYAGGRKELRADLRTKARAKKRMNKAVKTIKQKVPRTVDIVYRQAIDEIKATIDPSLRSKKT
ncbi:MAG: hypothetical protein MUP81_05100, partial [Dehalococcoidia bacterium]|nr:hypothetical protein [Dehalococcoidia bacterium]